MVMNCASLKRGTGQIGNDRTGTKGESFCKIECFILEEVIGKASESKDRF